MNDTTAWYEGLQAANGGDASDFARFFPVPGMAHCAGGPSTDQFDLLTPLVEWVERGQAPERVIAHTRAPAMPSASIRTCLRAGRPTAAAFVSVPQGGATQPGATDLETADSFRCQ